MRVSQIVPACLAVGAGLVSAQRGNDDGPCKSITIENAQQASNIACGIIDGDLIIDEGATGEIIINGPQTIKGNIEVINATRLITLSSPSIQSIEGTFRMRESTSLNSLSFTQLRAVKAIEWTHVPTLRQLIFGTVGVTKVESITISDSQLGSLTGLNLGSVDTLVINNNRRLTEFSSSLVNVSKRLEIGPNGSDLTLAFPNLIWASEIVISDTVSVSMPSLSVVNDSLRFDKNRFTSFSAPNLTSTLKGDIAFTANDRLTNLSFPLLETIAGSFTIQNNTALDTIDGFPKLTRIEGAVLVRGNFTDVKLPALTNVEGAFDIQSTGDIASSCEPFDKMKGRGIAGSYKCASNNERANEGGNSGSGGGTSNKPGGGAGSLAINLPVIVGASLLGGLALL